MNLFIQVANESFAHHAETICQMIKTAAKARGTGIAERNPEYIKEKMRQGNAVVACDGSKVIGFCYIETWDHGAYVAHSGLIVHPEYRNKGLAEKIKRKIFNLSQTKFPKAKIFGITTGLAVMKINSELGYVPVTYSELTTDKKFWEGCKSCRNYHILKSNNFKNCLCTAMVYKEPEKKAQQNIPISNSSSSSSSNSNSSSNSKLISIIKKS